MIQVEQKSTGEIITLNKEQENIVREAIRRIKAGDKLFQYAAPAGCGKSIVLRAIIEQLGLSDEEIIPMAYTGSASMIMRKNGFYTAKTCHSWLYLCEIKSETDPVTGKTKQIIKYIRRYLDKSQFKLILIDEASMVPHSIRKDIEKTNIPVIACGDLDQLPPISGDSAYLNSGRVWRLTKIMRQAKLSSIVLLSDMLRKGIRPKIGDYGEVLVIPYSYLTESQLLNAEVIICGYNNTRDAITNFMRKRLGYKTPLPCYGEKVICRENNWDVAIGTYEETVNLVNGLMGICKSQDGSISRMNGKGTFRIDFSPIMFPQYTFEDIICDYNFFTATHQEKRMIKDFEKTHPKIKRYNKFEFGYSITTHMSQGNQYNHGIFLEENFRQFQNKINYTGITRFIDHCIYVLSDYHHQNRTLPPYGIPSNINKCVMYLNGQPQI